MSGIMQDLLGTMLGYFKIGGTAGVRLKNSSGNLLIRNTGDSADAELTTSKIHVSGDIVEINSDAVESGADWKLTLQRPTSGMTADINLILPPTNGSSGQVLSNDGTGTTSWVSAASTSACISTHSETLAFGTSSPLTLFTLPANAQIYAIDVIVDTAFAGGTNPTVTVGISGTTSKYTGASDVDLTTAGRYRIHPLNIPVGTTEALIATYAAGGSTSGSARIITSYTVPAA